ncbi:MAG: SAM-dependent methyltransferase [Proteobacteria bacterium]|nr:MAG: SAM-dependent methyltransferase [Pseudomonadota bacterium]
MVLTPTRPRLEAAISALQVVLGLTRPADAALKLFFRDHHELGQHDRGFVAELVFCVLRNLRLLEHEAGTPTPRRLALLALATQFGFSVRELSPLISRSEETLLATSRATDLEQLPPQVRFSVPDWLYDGLSRQMTATEVASLARALLQSAPLDLRVNTMLADRKSVLSQFEAEGIAASVTPFSPVGVRLAEKSALQRHALFVAGKVEVQDEGSQLLAYLLAPRRREMVVDFCAGAGGKTLALGAMMHSEGRVYAFDTAEKRLANLSPRLRRSGLSNVHPQLIDSETDPRVRRLTGKIDRVLVDAPCSGLGTLRRNPDLKWRQNPQAITEMVEKQRSILAAASRLVKPGGRLIYATCSLLEVENDAVVDAFLSAHPEFSSLSSSEALRAQRIELDTGERFRVFPHLHGMDGFFAALMERRK